MSIQTTALEYFNQGFNIVLFRDKKPLHDWQKWQTERQTLLDFNSLPWPNANQFGVVCGTQTYNGVFLGVIDFDVKNLPQDTISKGIDVLADFPITRLEETPSGGKHLIYHCRTEPRSVSAYHNICALELIGKGKLCIMSPSLGYKSLNDNSPSEVQDLVTLFTEYLEKAGVTTKESVSDKQSVWFDREDLESKAFKGNNPLCVHEILKGVSEGLRNESAIRLSSYSVNFRQLTPQKAYRDLLEWNRLNQPPLPESELRSIFESAIKGKYVFGCEDSILKGFCTEKAKADCSLRKKQDVQENQKPVFDTETEVHIEAEVQRILDAENQLEALKPHLDNMITGEENGKKSLVVLVRSAKVPDPEAKQIIMLKATEGAGKSTIQRNAVKGYKVKNVGRFSTHALDYSNLEGYEILSLKELGAMDTEKQGVSTIKFLSSDDGGYTVEITVKDESTGRFTTEQRKIPPITIVSSTTRLILESQFDRRAWSLGLDESTAQTERIAEWYAKLESQKAEKMLGLRKYTDYEFSCEVYSRLNERFKPEKIIIPFPHTLTTVLDFKVLRIRGDIPKLFMFVKLYGQFNLKRLARIGDIYVMNSTVAVEALKIALEPLIAMLSRIDSRSKIVFNTLHALKDVVNVHGEQNGIIEKEISYDHQGNTIDKKLRDRIAIETGKSEDTIRKFFNQLESAGYVSSNSKKKSKVFTLLYDVNVIEQKYSGLHSKIESPFNLTSEMDKEAQNWLNSPSRNQSVRTGDKNESMDKNIETILSPIHTSKFRDGHLDNIDTALTECRDNITAIEKCGVSRDNSQETVVTQKTSEKELCQKEIQYQCPYCLPKPMRFSQKADLLSHCEACHIADPEPNVDNCRLTDQVVVE